MKKLLLLAMLLGLTGCGDNNQSDTTQTNTQANTLQKAEAAPVVANYSLVASPRAMSALAPLQGWDVTKSTVMGASTLIDAIKDTKVSAALVTPNAKQVAEVLRGGAAGVALNIAVEQLLGAVDWVMDPENSQIKYTIPSNDSNDPTVQTIYTVDVARKNLYAVIMDQACSKAVGVYFNSTITSAYYNQSTKTCWVRGLYSGKEYVEDSGRFLYTLKNPLYDPNAQKDANTLPLETVAEQVISNADAGSLDAQVATNLAAQNILNDEELAKPVVQELEYNSRDKCYIYYTRMDDKAGELERRYRQMYEDEYDMYNKYYPETKPFIKNGINYGSWMGHVRKYRSSQFNLNWTIEEARNKGCNETRKATEWKSKAPPPQPGMHS
ncbi:hypothetical protein F993_01507 [Acinetobacter proteolyticus]|uniref:Lipoprotein n=1 Tax=Acinetobacter proteolyticus TaxID=1776741 RepID=A0ABP2TPA1_9GAMM|nr:hypothetical protein [Acinetobacter proteolyticus]ENU24191.1 hypothetical protein F993_01507 [Acinetobacter proteolyticus]